MINMCYCQTTDQLGDKNFIMSKTHPILFEFMTLEMGNNLDKSISSILRYSFILWPDTLFLIMYT